MARYKKALSIYIKQSWIDEINLFASRNEESVSEYIERAVNFQLIHDRKIYQKELKEKETKELTFEDLIEMDDDRFDALTRQFGKAADFRIKSKIAKTRYIDDNNE